MCVCTAHQLISWSYIFCVLTCTSICQVLETCFILMILVTKDSLRKKSKGAIPIAKESCKKSKKVTAKLAKLELQVAWLVDASSLWSFKGKIGHNKVARQAFKKQVQVEDAIRRRRLQTEFFLSLIVVEHWWKFQSQTCILEQWWKSVIFTPLLCHVTLYYQSSKNCLCYEQKTIIPRKHLFKFSPKFARDQVEN